MSDHQDQRIKQLELENAGLSKTVEDLRRAEEYLRAIIATEPECVKTLALDGSVIDINPAGLRMIEADSLDQVKGSCIYPLATGEHRAAFERLTSDIFRGQSGSLVFEMTGLKGRRRWLEMHAAPLHDKDGRIAAEIAITRDITERVRAERSVQRLNRVYAVLIATNEMILRERNEKQMLDAACDIAVSKGEFRMAWIGMLEAATGRVHPVAWGGEVAGYLDHLNIVISDPDCQSVPSARAILTASHAVCSDLESDPPFAPWRDEALRRRFRASASFPLRVEGRIVGVFNLYSDRPEIFDAEEVALLNQLALDISFALDLNAREVGRRQLEEQLRQAQKMEALGQLAGGVAHDFNNILAAIMMQADLVGEAAPPEIEERLQQIRAYSERAANLTRQLLLLSRRQVIELRDLDLNESVTDLAKMLRRIIGDNVALQLHLHNTPLFTRADAGMLDQVLLNLAVNARDAMPHGGRLLIATSEITLDADAAHRSPEASVGRYVSFSVKDSGIGIATEVLPHIFEPFFTTKDSGKGTGLGLATVFGIVKQHRGWIEVSSEAGVGATFQVFLPASEVAAASPSRAPVVSRPAGGTETILLVEDESSVRLLTGTILERVGYRVLSAANGMEALRVWDQNSGEVKLLLTDIMMPEGMSGFDLADMLHYREPRLRVLFTSGYSGEHAGRERSLREGQNFLQKPASTRHLLETIRHVLDR